MELTKEQYLKLKDYDKYLSSIVNGIHIPLHIRKIAKNEIAPLYQSFYLQNEKRNISLNNGSCCSAFKWLHGLIKIYNQAKSKYE